MLGADTAALAAATDAALARLIASSAPGTAHGAEAELYRRFAPRVRLYGLKHLRNEAAAQDLAQQVLLVTIERLRAAEVHHPEQIGSFILGTSRLLATGVRRTEERRAARRVEFGYLLPTVVLPADAALDRSRLERCLAELGERERSVLVLTFYAERPAAEIAETLGMSPGAVRVRRHRALARMRECLEGLNADGR